MPMHGHGRLIASFRSRPYPPGFCESAEIAFFARNFVCFWRTRRVSIFESGSRLWWCLLA
uniref:Uncharacterized protein n=1 Tax=Physcomitrium patens TaxID=3218 RepID=A0A2K1L7E4_PHYPA|nr:hypothetical protein PHYPA_000338 [Physcomitrium patens]